MPDHGARLLRPLHLNRRRHLFDGSCPGMTTSLLRSSLRLLGLNYQSVRRVGRALGFEGEDVAEPLGKPRLARALCACDGGEAGILKNFLEKGERKNRHMLSLAENEVLKSAPEASPLHRPFGKPCNIAFETLPHSHVTVRAAKPDDTARPQTAKDLSDVVVYVRKVLDNVM